jgi:hypothetical protein
MDNETQNEVTAPKINNSKSSVKIYLKSTTFKISIPLAIIVLLIASIWGGIMYVPNPMGIIPFVILIIISTIINSLLIFIGMIKESVGIEEGILKIFLLLIYSIIASVLLSILFLLSSYIYYNLL